MKRLRKRDAPGNNLSFLDVISAGFGAIVLLLVITKSAQPTLIIEESIHLADQAEQLRRALPAVNAEIDALRARLGEHESELAALQHRLRALAPQAAQQATEEAERSLDLQAAGVVSARLEEARQSLTEEMQRLLGADFRRRDDVVAGIPVDSEYIIFIIDTSGSMLRAWNQVMETIEHTLEVYPRVRGFQIMNDMGRPMFDRFADRWIPDSPAMRRAVLSRLAGWHPFSNSSPVEGIISAIRTYAEPDKRISLYVLGDEFTGVSIQDVIDQVDRINPRGPDGRRLVRIHSVGYPTQYFPGRGIGTTGVRYATLMRALAGENDGTFVALQSDRRSSR